jgi:hypothetical protein
MDENTSDDQKPIHRNNLAPPGGQDRGIQRTWSPDPP